MLIPLVLIYTDEEMEFNERSNRRAAAMPDDETGNNNQRTDMLLVLPDSNRVVQVLAGHTTSDMQHRSRTYNTKLLSIDLAADMDDHLSHHV